MIKYEVVPLTREYLYILLEGGPLENSELHRSYFSQGSASMCLLADGQPVFAGGIVNLQWNRGEAWILPTKFFRRHVLVCMRSLKKYIPVLASQCGFVRVQATCVEGVCPKLIRRLGFIYEGTMQKFGPNGESCRMYARIMN